MGQKLDDSHLRPVEDAQRPVEPEPEPKFRKTGDTIEEATLKTAKGREIEIVEAAVGVVLQWNQSYDTVRSEVEQRLIDAVADFHRALREEHRSR